MSAPRVGILGGTFDPIHVGHVAAARLARERLQLDSVWLMPSHEPPHRTQQPRASAFHRFAMTALACAGDLQLSASPIELQHRGPTYTADTLARLHGRGLLPTQIFFITGADAFAEIATWKLYPAVLDMATFAVVSRTTLSLDTLIERVPALAGRWVRPGDGGSDAPIDPPVSTTPLPVVLVEGTLPNVSATDVRERVQRGESVRGLVPDLVAEYIARQRLYADASASLV